MLHPFFNIDRPVIPKPAQECKSPRMYPPHRKIVLRNPFTIGQLDRSPEFDVYLPVHWWDWCGKIFKVFPEFVTDFAAGARNSYRDVIDNSTLRFD